MMAFSTAYSQAVLNPRGIAGGTNELTVFSDEDRLGGHPDRYRVVSTPGSSWRKHEATNSYKHLVYLI